MRRGQKPGLFVRSRTCGAVLWTVMMHQNRQHETAHRLASMSHSYFGHIAAAARRESISVSTDGATFTVSY